MMRTLAVVSLLHIFDQAAAGVPKPERPRPVNDDSCDDCLERTVRGALTTEMYEQQVAEANVACMFPFICNQPGPESDWTGQSRLDADALRAACAMASAQCAWKTLEDGLENIDFDDPIIEIESNGPGDMKMHNEKVTGGGNSYWLGEEAQKDFNVAARRKGSPPAPQLAPAKEAGSTVVV